jgi:hypothetical protein
MLTTALEGSPDDADSGIGLGTWTKIDDLELKALLADTDKQLRITRHLGTLPLYQAIFDTSIETDAPVNIGKDFNARLRHPGLI